MNANEYQQLAARTECDQMASRHRMHGVTNPVKVDLTPVRLNHAVLGLAGEVGELAGAVERWIYYGKDLDYVNVSEELGDCLWYIALACNALGLDMGLVMQANIYKLCKRYPDRYNDAAADPANRDRAAERAATEGGMTKETLDAMTYEPQGPPPLTQDGHGWAEPPYDEDSSL